MTVSALAKALNSAIGENASEDEVTNYLDTGYKPLNHILSGDYDRGLPYGRMGEIYGPPAAGKTVLATMFMIAAQKAGGLPIFIDWERAFNADFARQVGLNTDSGAFVYKRPRTWEEGNTIAMTVGEMVRKQKLIAKEAPILVVLDSIAAAVPQSVTDTVEKKGIAGLSMNDTTALARVTSTTLKTINLFSAEYNMIMVYLNQIRTKPGVVYGNPITTPGGQAMEFFATWRLALGSKKIMVEENKVKEFTGRLIGANTSKNKMTRPFQSLELRLEYAPDGRCYFNTTLSMVEYLEDLGKLKKAKAGSVTWIDGKDYTRKDMAIHIDSTGAHKDLDALLPR